MSTLTEQLRADIAATRADINRIEGQQETAKSALAELEAEVTSLGFSTNPMKLVQEVTALEEDVQSTLEALREEVASIGSDTNTDR